MSQHEVNYGAPRCFVLKISSHCSGQAHYYMAQAFLFWQAPAAEAAEAKRECKVRSLGSKNFAFSSLFSFTAYPMRMSTCMHFDSCPFISISFPYPYPGRHANPYPYPNPYPYDHQAVIAVAQLLRPGLQNRSQSFRKYGCLLTSQNYTAI